MRHLEINNETVIVVMNMEEHLKLRNILDTILDAVNRGEPSKTGTWLRNKFITNTEMDGIQEISNSFNEVWDLEELLELKELEK